MGDWGDGLIDVGDSSDERTFIATDSISAGEATRRLQNALQRLATVDPLTGRRPGGTIYFPPFRYQLEAPPRTIVVPLNVTLMFAPGAILTLGLSPRHPVGGLSNADLAIDGFIDAGPWQIVTTELDPETGGLLAERGRLVLASEQLRVVYPEWFGARPATRAGPDINHDSWPGLQAAINAAIHDRADFRGVPDASPIPIELNGVYEISRPLQVGYGSVATRPEDRRRSFVLRSASDRSGAARSTLRPRPDFAAADAPARDENATLLRIQGPSSFLIEGVEFDGADRDGVRRAFSCARVEVEQEEGKRGLVVPGGDAQLSRFRHCVFRRAKTVLLQLGELVDPFVPLPAGRLLWNSGQDLLGFQVQRCAFDHGDDLSGLDLRWWRDGVFFAAGNTFELHFVDCSWRGRMRAGLRGFGGRASFTGCSFDLRRVPVPLQVVTAQGRRHHAEPGEWSAPRLGVGRGQVDVRDNGCDLFIDYPLVGDAILSGLFVRDCQSRSWRHFATFAPHNLSAAPGYTWSIPSFDVQFTDLRVAAFAVGDPMAQGWEIPPSMLWDFRGLHFGVTLTLNDVRLPGPVTLGLALAIDPSAGERVHPEISGALLIAPGTPLPTEEPDSFRVYDLGLRRVRGRLPACYLPTGPLDDRPQPWYRVLGPRAVV